MSSPFANSDTNDPFGFNNYGKLAGSTTFNPDGTIRSISGGHLPYIMQLQKAADEAAPNPEEPAAIEARAAALRQHGYADSLSANPPVMRSSFAPDAMPRRNLAPFPQQDRDSVNPMVAGLGLLAGAVVPQAAGDVNASILAGAHAATQDSMAQRAQNYQRQADAAGMLYNDQLTNRNESNKYRLLNDDRQFQNKELQREWALQKDKLNTDAKVPETVASDLTAYGVKQQAHNIKTGQVAAAREGIGLDLSQQKTDAEGAFHRGAAAHYNAEAESTNALRPIRVEEGKWQAKAAEHGAGLAGYKEQEAKAESDYANKRALLGSQIMEAQKNGEITKVGLLQKQLQQADEAHAASMALNKAQIGHLQAETNLANTNASLARAGIKFKVSGEAYQAARALTGLSDEDSKAAQAYYNTSTTRLMKANQSLQEMEQEYLGKAVPSKDGKTFETIYARPTLAAPGAKLPGERERRVNMMSDERYQSIANEQKAAALAMQHAEVVVNKAAANAGVMRGAAAKKFGVVLPADPFGGNLNVQPLPEPSKPGVKKPGPKGAAGGLTLPSWAKPADTGKK